MCGLDLGGVTFLRNEVKLEELRRGIKSGKKMRGYSEFQSCYGWTDEVLPGGKKKKE